MKLPPSKQLLTGVLVVVAAFSVNRLRTQTA